MNEFNRDELDDIEPITDKSWTLILNTLGIEAKVEERHYSHGFIGPRPKVIPLSDVDNRRLSVLYRDRSVIDSNLLSLFGNDLYTLDEKIKIITKHHEIRSEFNLLTQKKMSN